MTHSIEHDHLGTTLSHGMNESRKMLCHVVCLTETKPTPTPTQLLDGPVGALDSHQPLL